MAVGSVGNGDGAAGGGDDDRGESGGWLRLWMLVGTRVGVVIVIGDSGCG